ncbi:MAG: HEPN domain-containing protein [Candidatus Aenigmarchaeota archaeon]|nr:HEPN domain-containing protein [Candidatus Aenigmarchaeota archaeon]
MKTRQVDRSKASFYLQKAEECKNSMKRAFEAGEWNACVINAIHSAISSADALCVAKLGMRNAGERHTDALILFSRIEQGNEEFKKSAKHLSELLRIKTDAEYGERLFYEKDAGMAVKHAERFLSFVKEKIREY